MKIPPSLTRNLTWKLGAFLLALLAWSVINSAIDDDSQSPGFLFRRTRTFSVPVTVRILPEDSRAFVLRPRQVKVILSGNRETVLELSENQVQAFVDLVNAGEETRFTASVLLHTPAGIRGVSLEPDQVEVEVTHPSPKPTPAAPHPRD